MKISFLLGSLNRGGTETLVLDSLRHINEIGIDAYCIYRMDGLLSKEFRNTGVKMHKLRPRHLFDISYIFKLRRVLKREKINIAHAQQPIDAFYAYLATIGTKIRIILSIHGYDFKYPKLTKAILRLIHGRIALNIFVSHAQKEYFEEKYGFKKGNIKVLYNGISVIKFNNFAYSSLKIEFNIPEDHLLLGTVGNFNPARDQVTICRFLKLLDQQNVKFSFVFAGAQTKADPWYYDECFAYCDQNYLLTKVFFPGSRSDIPNFLSQLDAFIYSTDHDTFGIAIIEAMYMAVPVFVNDWEVIKEITENGRFANLYRTKNEQDLLIKFMHFVQNRKDYIEKAREGAQWVKGKFSIVNHLNNLNDIYKEIL